MSLSYAGRLADHPFLRTNTCSNNSHLTSLLDQIRGLRATVVGEPVDPIGHDAVADRERVDLIAALEQLKSAACAGQADLLDGVSSCRC